MSSTTPRHPHQRRWFLANNDVNDSDDDEHDDEVSIRQTLVAHPSPTTD